MGILVFIFGVVITLILLSIFNEDECGIEVEYPGPATWDFYTLRRRPYIIYRHQARLETIWTIVPSAILCLIAIPSFSLAMALDEELNPWLWVKVIGNQWYWTYEFSSLAHNPDKYDNVSFDAFILRDADLRNKALRLLATDSSVTIPLSVPTKFLITSNDVLHSWAAPGLGIKTDACPGRINSVNVLPFRAGVYYGQCSEICGVGHGFMPITVEVVRPKNVLGTWSVRESRKK